MPATVAGASETMRARSRFFPLSEPLPVPRRLMSQKTPAARKPCGARIEPGIAVSLAFMGAIRICLTGWQSGSLPPLAIGLEMRKKFPMFLHHYGIMELRCPILLEILGILQNFLMNCIPSHSFSKPDYFSVLKKYIINGMSFFYPL